MQESAGEERSEVGGGAFSREREREEGEKTIDTDCAKKKIKKEIKAE